MPSLKRKRDAETSSSTTKSSRDAIDAIFRANFESKFGAIDVAPVRPTPSSKAQSKKHRKDTSLSPDEDEDEDEEEEQLDSEAEDEDDEDEEEEEEQEEPTAPTPEIISYDFSRRGPPPSTKPSPRTFMSSKPPTSISAPTQKAPSTKLSKEEEATELLNLKNDTALQRLLSESHLLDQTTLSHSSGKNRLKAIESRIVALGGPPLTQQKVPIAIKRGMIKKQKEREEKAKKVAWENGIVTAKESKRAKERRKDKERMQRRGKRDKGVGHASVGKFKGGELKLSRRDVENMRA